MDLTPEETLLAEKEAATIQFTDATALALYGHSRLIRLVNVLDDFLRDVAELDFSFGLKLLAEVKSCVKLMRIDEIQGRLDANDRIGLQRLLDEVAGCSDDILERLARLRKSATDGRGTLLANAVRAARAEQRHRQLMKTVRISLAAGRMALARGAAEGAPDAALASFAQRLQQLQEAYDADGKTTLPHIQSLGAGCGSYDIAGTVLAALPPIERVVKRLIASEGRTSENARRLAAVATAMRTSLIPKR